MPLLPVVILSMFAGMDEDLFDAAQMYDEDYLYFFAAEEGASEFAPHGPAVPGAGVPGEAAAELAWRLLDLRPGMSVLDLACGHGEMAGWPWTWTTCPVSSLTGPPHASWRQGATATC